MIINTSSCLMCTVNKVVSQVSVNLSSLDCSEHWETAQLSTESRMLACSTSGHGEVPRFRLSPEHDCKSAMRPLPAWASLGALGFSGVRIKRLCLRALPSYWLIWSWTLTPSGTGSSALGSSCWAQFVDFPLCKPCNVYAYRKESLQTSEDERHHFIIFHLWVLEQRANMQPWLYLMHGCQVFWKYIEECSVIFGCTEI